MDLFYYYERNKNVADIANADKSLSIQLLAILLNVDGRPEDRMVFIRGFFKEFVNALVETLFDSPSETFDNDNYILTDEQVCGD